MRSSPCQPWPIDPTCCTGWPTDPADWTAAHLAAQAEATATLWRATGGIFDSCQLTVRPCLDACGARWWDGGAWVLRPWIDEDGSWRNGMCGCGDDCSCSWVCTVSLPGPVQVVESVYENGALLLPGVDYRRYGQTRDKLARIGACWPDCQDRTVPDIAEGALSVTYLQGMELPPGASRAVSQLACILLQRCGDHSGQCPVPLRPTPVDNGTTLPAMWSGYQVIDSWISSVNPYGNTERASVYSLDLPMYNAWHDGSARATNLD